MKRPFLTLLAFLITAVGVWAISFPGNSSAQSGTRQVAQTFESRLWSYLQSQKYRNWAPVPGESDDFYPGESPHGAYLKMYLNRTAAGNPKNLPFGSVLVKENYGEDEKTLMAVTVMYRVKGYNPDAGDWWWAKYNPNGTVARAPESAGRVLLRGKPKGCIQCHGDAQGGDFAFMND